MKKVAVIQSNYLPWKGYFDIINDVDLFIFYDDVQYTQGDWRNRNRVKTTGGLTWITIPTGSNTGKLIHEIELKNNIWQKKHWATIQQAYSKRPYFKQYKDFFATVFKEKKWTNLSRLNQYLIQIISTEFLHIETTFKDSRDFQPEGDRVGRLIDLLRKVGASHYLSGPSAKDYLGEKQFQDAGIALSFKDYSGYPEYHQSFPPFEHKVSIIDLLFNCGPNAPEHIWGWRENSKPSSNNYLDQKVKYE